MPTEPTCDSPAMSTGRTETAAVYRVASDSLTLKIRLVIVAGTSVTDSIPATWPGDRGRRSYRDDGHDHLLKRWPAVVEGEIAA